MLGLVLVAALLRFLLELHDSIVGFAELVTEARNLCRVLSPFLTQLLPELAGDAEQRRHDAAADRQYPRHELARPIPRHVKGLRRNPARSFVVLEEGEARRA